MGKLRESNDPEMQFPSSWFGFVDWPIDGMLLIDDISETILTKNIEQGFGDFVTYREYDALKAAGLHGARMGRQLKGKIKC